MQEKYVNYYLLNMENSIINYFSIKFPPVKDVLSCVQICCPVKKNDYGLHC